MNYRNINLIFFNNDIICFIVNIYSNEQQTALKYIKANLNNVLIITRNFNIRNNDWNPTYSYYSIYIDILMEIADFFDFRMFTFYIQVPTWYVNNLNNSNLVIDLMFP